MIRYALKCDRGHGFEAWFRDSAAYDTERAEGRLACGLCGSAHVEKAIMAPAVSAAERRTGPKRGPAPAPAPLSEPASPQEAMLAALRRKIEETSDYVGPSFASEARRIHAGEAEERPIWGEASLGDAKALADDGIPVAPIPWMVKRDA